MPLGGFLTLGLAAAPAIIQGVKGIQQKKQARKLKVSNFVPPELLMNRDLASQQAFSRRAPGAAYAESQARRTQANQIGAAQRSFGGDANKMATITSAATAQANDAGARIAAQGQQFSEGAFDRMAGANLQIAGQKRQNQTDYTNQYNMLNTAGDTNLFNAGSNLASAGITGLESGIGNKAGRKALKSGATKTGYGASKMDLDSRKRYEAFRRATEGY